MDENGSNPGPRSLPPDNSHPEFLALCTLATSGALEAHEQKRLWEHLSRCTSCCRAMAQYEAIIGTVLPALAGKGPDQAFDIFLSGQSIDDAEASLFARLGEEGQRSPISGDLRPETSRSTDSYREAGYVTDNTLWRHLWWQYAAGLILLAALGFAVYCDGIRRGKELVGQTSPSSASTPPIAAKKPDNHADTSGLAAFGRDRRGRQIDELRAQIEQQSAEITRLKVIRAQLGSDRNAKASDAEQLSREDIEFTQQLSTAKENLQDVQQNLNSWIGQDEADVVKVASLEGRVSELNDLLHQRDQQVARDQDLLDHDRDIRELMGERDLYIAEVYDVARTGGTEKPFGRVFYTRGKSLILYAYDLDQQAPLKNTAIFQAWGQRGPDTGDAVNLGILYQDNAAKKRWVLKLGDPKSLGNIDAIFVTIEPDGGSAHPSGKPFLFAYLRNDPNHP